MLYFDWIIDDDNDIDVISFIYFCDILMILNIINIDGIIYIKINDMLNLVLVDVLVIDDWVSFVFFYKIVVVVYVFYFKVEDVW